MTDSAVRTLLDSAGVAGVIEPRVSRMGNGQSNLTYLVEDDAGRRWVARRPPLGTALESAHDVHREARIMHALADTDVPVPRVLAQARVADVPWVLLEHLAGIVVESTRVAVELPAQARRELGPRLVARLAGIHAVDLDRTGLGQLASRAPYAERQLRRWGRQWDQGSDRCVPALDQLTAGLTDGLSRLASQESRVLVHGDFHLRNVVVRDADVVGVLDWELATLGHPLADLGTLLAYWPMPGEMPASDSSPSLAPGWASREALVEAYARVSGVAVDDHPFWHALGLWKLAIIAEGVRQRVLDEPRNGAPAGAPTTEVVDAFLARGHDVLRAWRA